VVLNTSLCEGCHGIPRTSFRNGLPLKFRSFSADQYVDHQSIMANPLNESESRSFAGGHPMPERRRFARYIVRLPLELRVEGSDIPLRLETTDLSRNGCYVENNMPLSVGTKVQAKLWLGGTRLILRGRVVTSHPQYGNGILFLDYEGDAELRLRTFLDALSPDLMEGGSPEPASPDRLKI